MTVNNEASSVSFTGNGVTTVFPYTFRIPEDDMGHVGILDIATSVLTELAPGTYSIIGVGSAFGGSVTYNPLGVPIPNTKRIVIYRDLDLVQELDLTNQSPYFAETLEETLDRIVMMLQQVSDAAARSIKVTLGSTTSPDVLVAQLLATQAAAALSASQAATSATNAFTSETNADASELLAMKWATNPEDTPVTVGPSLYSALHWAAKAAASAAAAAAFVTASWLAVLTAFATKATPTDADEFGYRQVSDGTGRKATWANLKTALLAVFNLNFPRYDIAQPVALTATQQAQLRTNIGLDLGYPLLHVVDEKTSGSNGGGAAATTWNQRDLNTTRTNTIIGASLAANQITLVAGTYDVEATAPAFRIGGQKLRLQNITDATTILTGTTDYNAIAGDYAMTRASLFGRFTLTASKVIQLQHYTTAAKTIDGLGVGIVSGAVEVFSDIRIRQLK